MANKKHLRILEQGVDAWNKWRKKSFDEYEGPNLRGTDLSKRWFVGVDLDLADLYEANLAGAYLMFASLSGADLRRANLSRAWLFGANICEADLSEANLSNACLMNAHLVDTNLEKTNLTGCSIYGISAWGLELKDATQSNLIITPGGEPTITVDNLEVAQFIYLLLHNEKIRHVIDTITSKVVLILGRFTPERKAVLDAIKEELRKHDYLPVLFDFEKPASRDFTETVSTLAHLARFVIADVTDARSVPQELQAIVPTLRVPILPLLECSANEYGMFRDFKKYPWVLEVYRYKDLNDLLASFKEKVIIPAEAKVKELKEKDAEELLKLKKWDASEQRNSCLC